MTGVWNVKTAGAWLLLGAVGCSNEMPPEVVESTLAPYNTILLEGNVADRADDDVAVREILFEPGWTAPTHYHNSDLYIYVIEGEFEVTMTEGNRTVYAAGDALRMAAQATMDARNPSTQVPLKLAVFQVGQPHAPFVVPVEPTQ